MLRNRLFSARVDSCSRLLHFFSLALIAVLTFAASGTMLMASAGIGQNTHPAKYIWLQPSLPEAALGTAYSAVLFVHGGRAPYAFSVLSGQLPSGLSLDPHTGTISGNPTQIDSFDFIISVTEADGASGTASYRVAVTPCTTCVTVTVSPQAPMVAEGDRVQFSAEVSNARDTAVSWSASAGSISADGLFTAPAHAASKTVTVTATSTGHASAHASVSVTITAAGPTISTARIPDAVDSTPYNTSLVASGGRQPYQWSIASGSLPAGLQLSSTTGTLTGSATKTGSFPFSIRVTDANAHSATQSLTLEVSASTATCGPPTYNCSRTDHDIVQLPTTLPNVGNLSGANTIVTDPAFGNRIVRITDAHTDPGAAWTFARTFVTADSGSADENLWNIDSTLLVLESDGGAGYPMAFNSKTMQASRLYASSFPDSAGLKLPGGGTWSRENPNVLYVDAGTTITKYDFTDRANPPSPQVVLDFASSPNCLPHGFSVTWKSRGGVSADDTVFGMAYSNLGSQGTATYAVAYKVGSGCRMLNTRTGEVTGDWGIFGFIGIKDRWNIHNAKISKDGNWLIIAVNKCTSGGCSKGPYFWQIGTTNVSSCGDSGLCGGHWTEGYSHWVNNNNTPLGNQVIRSFSDPSPHSLTHSIPGGLDNPFDQHQSWNNVDSADSVPFLASTCTPTSSGFPAPWYNEILGVAGDGSGKVWRFAHSFISAKSPSFSTRYAIGSVSQDGRFFLFSSDWMGTLGSESGSATCSLARNCRGDVFAVELK